MEQFLVEYLANAVWQLPLLAVSAWLLLRIVRPRPLMAHRIWLATVLAALLLPLPPLSRIHGSTTGEMAAVPAQQTVRNVAAGASFAAPETARPLVIRSAPEPRGWAAIASRIDTSLEKLQNPHLLRHTMHEICGLFLLMLLFGIVRLVRGLHAAHGLVLRARPASLPADRDAMLQRYCEALGARRPVVRISHEISSPAVVGIWRPSLLLPPAFAGYTQDQLRAVFCHELAHVVRRDYLTNLLCHLAELPLLWHPASHVVQARVRSTRELVCDAVAAEQLEGNLPYARSLLSLAGAMLPPTPIQHHTLSFLENRTVKERVMSLMENRPIRGARATALRLFGGSTLMAVAVAAAMLLHVHPMLAQQAAPPPPPPAAPAAPAAPEQAPPAVPPAPPAPPSEPAAPTPPAPPAPPAPPKPPAVSGAQYEHSWTGADGKAIVLRNGHERDLTPAERRQVEASLAAAREQVRDAQRAVVEIGPRVQAEVARATAEAQRQVNSPEFRARMADAQRQVQEATQRVNSEEFRAEMGRVRDQVNEETRRINSAEFQRKMADVQAQVNVPAIRAEAMQEAMRSLAAVQADLQRQAAAEQNTH